MIVELKHYQLTCDDCKTTTFVMATAREAVKMPAGWEEELSDQPGWPSLHHCGCEK